MADQEHEGPDDDLEVSVSDLRPPAGTGADQTQRAADSSLQPRLTSQQRARRLAAALGVIAVALLLLLGSFSSVRDAARGLIASFVPTPTPTLGPGDDLFYFLPNVPSGTVLLDGHPLAHPPTLDTGHPLRLKRGRHQLEWRADLFEPLRCTLSVPHAEGDTCTITDRLFPPITSLSAIPQPLGAFLIQMHESLATLADTRRAALIMAAQSALDASRSTALVHPGERYFSALPGQLGQTVTATQPLQATLSFRLVVDPRQPGPCEIYDSNIQPCHFAGQACQWFCTVPEQDVLRTASPPEWLAGVIVRPSWDYVALDGTVVAHDVGELVPALAYFVLRIRWDGTQWQVTPVLGPNSGVTFADDAVCAPARGWLVQGPLSYVLDGSGSNAVTRYAAGPIPVDGCAVEITGYYQPGTRIVSTGPPALFLERFGLLLAANDAAHNLWPQIPVADADEQSLARELTG
jgi:hypothetical protein